MGALSALPALCEENHWSPVDSPHKGPVILNFDVFDCVPMNKLLNKQSTCRWFETPYRSINVDVVIDGVPDMYINTWLDLMFGGVCDEWLALI